MGQSLLQNFLKLVIFYLKQDHNIAGKIYNELSKSSCLISFPEITPPCEIIRSSKCNFSFLCNFLCLMRSTLHLIGMTFQQKFETKSQLETKAFFNT